MKNIDTRTTNVKHSRTFRNIRALYGLSDKAVLDIGCGFGEYLRLFGTGSVGITTTQAEIDYAHAHKLPVVFGNAETLNKTSFENKFQAVWANNLFEHLLSPHAFLMKLKTLSNDDGVIILGVPVVPKISSLLSLRWFRGALASNHVNFFTHTTLRLTVQYAGWKVLEVRPFIFKNAFLDTLVRWIAPHMYIVAVNDSHFVYPPKKVGEWIADPHYKELLSITRQV